MRTSSNITGSALLSALFIMTLVSIAATAMSIRLQLDIYRTRLTISADRLYLASQAIRFWAFTELFNPQNQFTKGDEQGKVLDLPKTLQGIYPGIVMQGGLYDLQARFNLNNVSDQKNLLFFTTFLKNTAVKLNQRQRQNLALALHHWISAAIPGQDIETFSSYYLKQKPPYFAAKQLMANVSEFRLLNGVNAALYQALQNYIIALPESTAININTAPKPLLKSLGYGLNEEQTQQLIAERGENGITNLQKINPLLQKLNISNEQITVDSQYFMTIATITDDDLTLTIYTVFKRNKDKKGKINLSIISEHFNTR